MTWRIEYYQSSTGQCPVEKFIDALDAKSQARIARTLELLEEFGTNLGMPYTKHIGNRIWELRIRHSSNRYRILYFLYSGRRFVMLHGFTKKSGPVPKKELATAENRRDDFVTRRP